MVRYTQLQINKLYQKKIAVSYIRQNFTHEHHNDLRASIEILILKQNNIHAMQ